MINIIENIRSKLNEPIKHRVVFDVDDVLCCTPITLYSRGEDRKESAIVKKRSREYSDAIVIDWEYEKDIHRHFFYPGLDKLILSILSWSNWSVDFFSSGIRERNEEVIPVFLKQVLAKHSNNADEDYEAIVGAGRWRIFSRQHMVLGKNSDEVKERFETTGNYKKNLTVVSEDIANTILVDDDRSYVAAGQCPFIGLSYTQSSHFRRNLHCEVEEIDYRSFFNSLKGPQYIMGILLSCKEELDSGRCSSLRQALEFVVQNNGKTLTDVHECTPWFLNPTIEAGICRKTNLPENPEFFNAMTRWIQKGDSYWEENYSEMMSKHLR